MAKKLLIMLTQNIILVLRKNHGFYISLIVFINMALLFCLKDVENRVSFILFVIPLSNLTNISSLMINKSVAK